MENILELRKQYKRGSNGTKLMKKTNKICEVPSCGRKTTRRGFCLAHYNNWRIYGDPMAIEILAIRSPQAGICSVNGCSSKSRTKKLCVKHYNRLRVNGDPNVSKVKRYSDNDKCMIIGCENEIKAKNKCSYHYGVDMYLKNREEIREREKQRFQEKYWGKDGESFRNKRKLQYKRWSANNPRSNPHVSLETKIAMANVRIRDNNTCQWYGCGKTHKNLPIHVHHIFLTSEHPELSHIEPYMICYCIFHHALWHKKRGDNSYAFLKGIIKKYHIYSPICLDCEEDTDECICNEQQDIEIIE